MTDEEKERLIEEWACDELPNRSHWVKPTWTKGDIDLAYYSGAIHAFEYMEREGLKFRAEAAHVIKESLDNVSALEQKLQEKERWWAERWQRYLYLQNAERTVTEMLSFKSEDNLLRRELDAEAARILKGE